MNRLQQGRLTAAQEARILAHLDRIEREHPDARAFLDRQRDMVRTSMIGEVAPDIVGKDYDGQTFKLSD